MIKDPAEKIQAFIESGVEPEVPLKRLVLKLSGRVADPHVAAELNDEMNRRLEDLLLDRALQQVSKEGREEALRSLLRLVTAGRH
ncbi:hypothetical protein [Tianweitania sediminis]|uniref:Uncharacterized protein n=1 Tax=Tianweitania sediminis TaxID=1502156 RepID=A0A8J7UHU2_9HYPH|nr:hypothetical protein [Tianweitania sediminis]MBP0439564.1 hypothetical protein [Tianweitania sediminis]